MALKHLVLNHGESTHCSARSGGKKESSPLATNPFKNNEVHFLPLEKLSKGLTVDENVTGRNTVQGSVEAEILCRALQKQLLPLLNPSPALGIRVPLPNKSLPTFVPF